MWPWLLPLNWTFVRSALTSQESPASHQVLDAHDQSSAGPGTTDVAEILAQ